MMFYSNVMGSEHLATKELLHQAANKQVTFVKSLPSLYRAIWVITLEAIQAEEDTLVEVEVVAIISIHPSSSHSSRWDILHKTHSDHPATSLAVPWLRHSKAKVALHSQTHLTRLPAVRTLRTRSLAVQCLALQT
jgi:hypothetical protein